MFPVVKGTACANGRNRVIGTINSKGKIDLVSFRDKKSYWGLEIPFLRGITILLFGLYVFMISLNRSQIILGKENKEEIIEENLVKHLHVSKSVMVITIAGLTGALAGIVGIILIPYLVFGALLNNGLEIWLSAFIISLIRIGLLLFILISLKIIPSMKQFYRHNSAGNLALASHKNKKIDSYHLSTNFLNFLVCGFLLSFFVVSFMIVDLNFFLRVLINIVLVLACFSITYEILKLLEFRNSMFTRALITPISWLTNEKPTHTERDIAFSVINEVVLMKHNEERLIGETKDNEIAFSVVYSEVKNKLNEAGISDFAEIDWLIAESLGKNRNDIKLLTHIGREDYKKIKNALTKREKRVPLTKIFNHANFYGYDFFVDKNVLSPRQETEQVVEEAIKLLKDRNEKTKVLDLMTGSGIIAITLAKQTKAKVFASDISESALAVARKNAKTQKVKIKFIQSDVFKNMKKERFDLIISNPPYIPSKDILTLDDEVKKYDPLIALDGGDDGLFFYREIAENATRFLNKGGILVLEIGEDQGQSVKKLLQKNFETIRIKKDYSNNDRIVIAKLKG
jgi:release factor glutamine methyltransferase